MSRTGHHKQQKHQHCGHDLWSRRPCAGKPYSAFWKRQTNRIERRIVREKLAKAQEAKR